jgi:hypothetical protein
MGARAQRHRLRGIRDHRGSETARRSQFGLKETARPQRNENVTIDAIRNAVCGMRMTARFH